MKRISAMSRKAQNKLFLDRRARKLNVQQIQNIGKRKNHSNYHAKDIRNGKLFIYLRDKNFHSNKKPNISGVFYLKIPEKFSMITNPNETLSFLSEVFNLCLSNFITDIHIDHSNCKEMDLSASTLFDIMLLELGKVHGNYISMTGVLPDDVHIRDMLIVSGIIKHLGIGYDCSSYPDIKCLPLIENGDCGEVATKIAYYIDSCLETQGYKLTPDGLNCLAEMVSEVVDNCDIHPGSPDRWYTIGHYFKNNDIDVGECQLTILDFGKTIYESIKEAKDKNIINSLDKLAKKHQKKGFFGAKWTEESLYTLYALQEGISRFKSKSEPDRGTGTIRLISNLESIGQTNNGKRSTMTIVSGNTCINFNGKYKLTKNIYKTAQQPEERCTVYFNKRNSPNCPPDQESVEILKQTFPGTIISMKFFIDPTYLKEITE